MFVILSLVSDVNGVGFFCGGWSLVLWVGFSCVWEMGFVVEGWFCGWDYVWWMGIFLWRDYVLWVGLWLVGVVCFCLGCVFVGGDVVLWVGLLLVGVVFFCLFFEFNGILVWWVWFY